MSKSLGFLFWGMLLVLLEFRAADFKLLSELVGYILLGIGCSRLAGASGNFKVAMVLAWILAVSSLFPDADLWVLQVPVLTIMMIWQVWYTVAGIMRMAESRGLPDLAASARGTRRGYLIVSTLCVVLPMFYGRRWGKEGASEILSVILPVAYLLVAILVLYLIYRSKSLLGNAEGAPGLAG